MLRPDEYLAHLSSDGVALARAAEMDLTAPVPSCPGWDVAELVRHTGDVHRHKAAIVRRGGTEQPADLRWPLPRDGSDDLLQWYCDGLDDLLTVLHADPDTPAYSWAGDHRVGFWQRRMAQETLVHRWDAENAVGIHTPVDAGLAADGVDELLRVFAPATDEPYAGPAGTIVLRATDTSDRWSVHVGEGDLRVDGAAGDDDASVEAPAAALLLGLWRRLPPERMTFAGRRELADAFLAWIDET